MFSSCHAILAQSPAIDSLENLLLKETNANSRIDILNEIAFLTRYKNNKKAYAIIDSIIPLAENSGYREGLARALNIRSMRKYGQSKFYECIQENDKALEIALETKSSFVLGKIYNTIASAYFQKFDYVESLEYYQKSLEQVEIAKDTLSACKILGNIGMLHTRLKNKEKAKIYFSKLEKLAIQQNSIQNLYVLNWRKGLLYEQYNNTDSAVIFFKKAIVNAKKLNDGGKIINIELYLGESYAKSDQLELAQIHIQKAIDYKKPSRLTQVRSNYWLGYINLKKGNFATARKYARDGLLKCLKTKKSENYISKFYSLITESSEGLGELDVAYESLGKLKNWEDSLQIKEKGQKILDLESKYQFEKQTIENKLLREEKDKNEAIIKQQSAFTFAALISIVSIGILSILLWRNGKKEKEHSLNLEKKVKERTIELENSNKQLENSNEELERFAYIASHDLKEPIRNIHNFSQLIKKDLEKDKNEKSLIHLEFVEQNTEQMDFLVNGILDYSRLNQTNNTENVNLNELVEEVKFYLSDKISNKKAKINCKQLPTIHSNKIYFFQIFKNLIENGIKYNNSQEPIIDITYAESGSEYNFFVSDNGIGIDEKYKNQIFVLFKRLHNRQEFKGAGLGLAIVQKVLENLGGRIEVESELGRGSKFKFTIPKKNIMHQA